MNWNKDISKIVYPIFWLIIWGYFLFNFYSNYQIKKFVNIYNEKNQYLWEVLESFWDKALSDSYLDIFDIKITDDEYNKITDLTNNMIKNGCPLLRHNREKCEKINSESLEIIDLLHDKWIDWTTETNDKINSYTSEHTAYRFSLKSDWVEF